MVTEPRADAPTYISKARAALLLDCSVRTVDRYCDRGLLIKHYDPVQHRAGIVASSVDHLAASRVQVDA